VRGKRKRIVLSCVAVAALAAVAIHGCSALRESPETDLSKSGQLAKPPPPLKAPLELKIVTFNIWDLHPFGTARAERMRAIGKKLAGLAPDLIGFQEAFYEGDRAIIMEELGPAGLSHSKYFHSGTVGSGLFVVSRFPIEESFFRPYSQRGKFYKPWHGDWWAGKGVCLARAKLPDGMGHVDFFNTHAHANYGTGEYDDVILDNLRECAAFVNEAATRASPALMAGDFNAQLNSPPGRALVQDAKLTPLILQDTGIDHIFFQENAGCDCVVLKSEPITGSVDNGGKKIGLSDHPGFISTIRLSPKK